MDKKTEFILTHPDRLPLEALSHLDNALKKTPENKVTLLELLDTVRDGDGEIFIITKGKIVGATLVQFTDEYMTIVLLGGTDIHDWKDEAYEFYVKRMKDYHLSEIIVLGRCGWGKIFKQLKYAGTLYSFTPQGGV